MSRTHRYQQFNEAQDSGSESDGSACVDATVSEESEFRSCRRFAMTSCYDSDGPACVDGVRVSVQEESESRSCRSFAMSSCVVVLLLFFCALLVSTLGLNFDLAISDLAQGDFHQSLVDLTSALQKIWVDYFLRALEQLFVQFPLLCTFVLSHWPWALLVLLVLLVFFGLPLLVGMWAPMKTGCTMIQAMETSFTKLTHMSVHVVLPVALFYGDLVSDALVMSKFWQAQHYQYFTLNALAILAGLVTTSVIGSAGMGSASEALQPIRGCTAVLTFLHVIPLYCFFFAFWQFADAKFATYKSDAFDRRLRDKGLTALMASSIIGETFGEAMLSSFVQLYAALRHGPLQWPSLLACSVLLSLISLGESFSKIDKFGHVSRYRQGQAVVVGLAKPQSVAYAALLLYRWLAVCSRLLLFPLFQLALHEELQLWHVAYGGSLLWIADCILQAGLVFYCTKNRWKLFFAIPNTLSSFEPLLLSGEGALLSVNVELHAVLHCAESVAAIWMANAFGSGVPALWEEHGFALRLFLASSVIQWPLLLILRCFCSHQLPSHDFVAVRDDCLSEEAQSICDSCDAKIPLYVAATVPFTMKSGCDVAKLLDLMMKGQASAQVAAQTCDLIKRHVLPKKSSELPADVTAASCMQAVLCAMDAHLSSPEVQEQAVWCLKNLALNRPENEETLMTLGGAEAILMAMTENCSNEAVQKEGCVAVAKLTTKHQNVLKFLSLGAGEAVLDALRNYTTSTGVQWWAFQALGNLAESSEGRAKLRNLLAADVINAAMSSGNSEIQEKGQQLLEKLGQVGHTGP